jgi:hypothetical protein
MQLSHRELNSPSVTDHLFHLRRCIRSQSSIPTCHPDNCAFWKQAYEKSEAAHNHLLNTHHELEQQVEQLRFELRLSKTTDDPPGVKRKRRANSAAKRSTESRQNYTDKNTMRTQEENGSSAESIVNVESSEQPGGCKFFWEKSDFWLTTEPATFFARSFIALRRLLSERDSDVNTLATSLSKTCVAAHESLSESIKSYLLRATTATSKEAAQYAFRDVIRTSRTLRNCYSSFLQALERLVLKTGGGNSGIYAIALLFEHTLGHIHETAAIEAGNFVEQDEQHAVNQQRPPRSNLDEMSNVLTTLVIHFFQALDLSKLAHDQLLDSLIYIFLDHLGSSLSLVVFADIDATSPTTAQLGFLPPRGLKATSHVDQETATKTAQYEARYLVTILHHLMQCIDKRQSLEKSIFNPPLTLDNSLTNGDSAFATEVRIKLQKTLLRGVFGEDDESFRDALQRPDTKVLDDHFHVASSGQVEPREWFVGEVWRLLGWSVLTGNGGGL